MLIPYQEVQVVQALGCFGKFFQTAPILTEQQDFHERSIVVIYCLRFSPSVFGHDC